MNLFLTLLIALNVSHAESLEHLRTASWSNKVPDVVLCNDADIESSLLKKAMDAWRERGEEVGKIVKKSCGSRPGYGEIGIYISSKMVYDDSAGETIRNVFNNSDGSPGNRIHHARVYIKPQYVDSYILLEHELGHALGFDDTGDSSSIMSKHGPVY